MQQFIKLFFKNFLSNSRRAAYLRRYRKYAFLIICVVAAIITPPDVMTLILVAVPLYCLYEVSILVVSRVEHR